MQRTLCGCLAIAIGLAGCKSGSNNPAESGVATNWFGSSVPRQSEPDMVDSEPADQKSEVRTVSAVERTSSTNRESGNVLTRWFQGGDKSSSPKRIPLPLTDADSKGSSPTDADDDF